MMNPQVLRNHFGSRLQQDVRLSNHTTSRVGGAVSFFVVSNSSSALAEDVQFLWSQEYPVFVLGSGSNILVSDQGLDVVVVQNKAKNVEFETTSDGAVVNAESGASLPTISRQAAQRGLTGLEWAASIPGTLGGAVYGNAGAHGGDMSQNLVLADILHRKKGRLSLSADEMAYSYRSSLLKRSPGTAVILSAKLALKPGDTEGTNALLEQNKAKRQLTQPTGPCMGSMFKNPEGDSAGRLIEAAGLKGTSIGGAQVSPVHANFMVNDGCATAEDYRKLIALVQNTVFQKFGVKLELEIEVLGKWQDLA